MEIARLHEMGDFGDDSLMQQQTENDDLSHHLDGVSVSMRWHLFEVFNRLHKMGQDWMIAVKSDHNGVHDDANLEGNSAPYALDRSSAGQNHRGVTVLKLMRRIFSTGFARESNIICRCPSAL